MKRILLLLLALLLFAAFLVGLYYLLPFGEGPDASRHRLITTAITGSVVVLVLALLWVRKLLASLKLKAAVSGEGNAEQGGETEEYAELERQFQRAVATLGSSKGGGLRASLALYRLPWFVLVGPPNAGKSTALRVSGLRFPRSQAVQGIGGTRNCDWWFSPEAIFLDTAGRYAREFEDEAEWSAFLDLLFEHRRRRPIDGILVMVGLDEVLPLGPGELDELADTLRERILEAYTHLRVRAPLLLLVTKVDLMEGFDACFGKLDPRERERAWGFALRDSPAAPDAFSLMLESRFGELVSRVEQFVLHRTLSVKSPTELEQVVAFRRHLSRVAKALTRFTSRLAEPLGGQISPYLTGVYLLSSQCGDQGALPMTDAVEQRFAVPWPGRFDGDPAERPAGPWFVRALFANVIVQKLAAITYRRARTTAARRFRVAVVVATFIFVAAMSGLMGAGFQKTRIGVDRARQAYLALKYGSSDGEGGALTELQHLEAFRRTLDRMASVALRPGNYGVVVAQLDRVY